MHAFNTQILHYKVLVVMRKSLLAEEEMGVRSLYQL